VRCLAGTPRVTFVPPRHIHHYSDRGLRNIVENIYYLDKYSQGRALEAKEFSYGTWQMNSMLA
jgi:hypothetical protein